MACEAAEGLTIRNRSVVSKTMEEGQYIGT